ncbi:MAG TPA: aldo/keto reductase [Longimicrobiales bacterium]
MQKRRLGNSDMEITPIGFGSWAIGGPAKGWDYSWGPQDDQTAIDAIHRALDLGINWIDTAAVYGLGHSEELVGRAVKSYSGKRPLVFTKCGLPWDEHGDTPRRITAASVRKECEGSLRRLQVETIDLYQIHWPTDDPRENEEGWRTMAELQREGKARWIGLSNWNVEQMRMALQIAPVTALQPPYSLLNRTIEKEILPFCQQNGIGVIVYAPMGSGLLTGAMTRERVASLPDTDWRKKDARFQGENLARALRIVEQLRAIGDSHGHTPAEVAIAWTLAHPAVTGAIVGGRNGKQVEETVRAVDLKLSFDEMGGLNALPLA